MKKVVQVSAFFCCLFMSQYGFAQSTPKSSQVPAGKTQNLQYSMDQKDQGTEDSKNYMQTSDQSGGQYYSQDNYNSQARGIDYSAQEACPEDHPCQDEACNDCWCMYCHYQPCYYYTQRCVEEQIPCKRRCCRYCPKYYEVQRCRYVPQYYNETYCVNEPEYYYVDECKTCQKWVCDRHCKYVPQYYWKHVCGDASCTTPCPR